ncbi:alpha/beta hydrolase [Nocardia sp. NPDC048505]|uniref:alpha/beta hydrolase n=1 Tax=Nocardia sp. NPDC048505 TaxID=3155756 RepID=UPI0033C778E7
MTEHLSRADLDREYSPSSMAPQYISILRRYRDRSDAARRQLKHFPDVSYGASPSETLHFFPPASPGAPLHVFVHGGHWQESSKEDSCFAAPGLVQAGAGFVALGYGLAPDRTLEDMVGSVRRGLRWLIDNSTALGTRRDRIYASGSSAGAHLVAMALAHNVDDAPHLAGAILLSGVYDLIPVQRSYVNGVVGMTPHSARVNSPVDRLPLRARRIAVARGAVETAEYARQHEVFVRALRRAGQSCTDLVLAGRNHFDLPLDLGDPTTPVGRAVLDQMDL